MKLLLSGLMATAIAATFAAAAPTPAKAEQVYIGDSGGMYMAEPVRWHHRHHHWRAYRTYDPYSDYDPYYYRSYHGFGAYDEPYYPRRYYYRHHYRNYYRPGLTLQFGWH